MEDVPDFLGGVPGFLGSVPGFLGVFRIFWGVFRVVGGVPGFLGVPVLPESNACQERMGFTRETFQASAMQAIIIHSWPMSKRRYYSVREILVSTTVCEQCF